jgi:hypothetical protein
MLQKNYHRHKFLGLIKNKRCRFHKAANILDIQRKLARITVSKSVQGKTNVMIRDMHIADTMKNALRGTEKLELVAEDINF